MAATRYCASKGALAAEGRGPGGLSPVDLCIPTTAGEPDCGLWTRVEIESGIGRTSDGVFQHS